MNGDQLQMPTKHAELDSGLRTLYFDTSFRPLSNLRQLLFVVCATILYFEHHEYF